MAVENNPLLEVSLAALLQTLPKQFGETPVGKGGSS
jgi:hypothetical protein